MKGHLDAFLSGLCAALGGLMAKLGLTDFSFQNLDLTESLVRLLCLVIMVLLNISMFTFFARALTTCKSGVEASLINTATNLVMTGLLGHVIFSEVLDLSWWLATLFITVGGYFVMSSEDANLHPINDKIS
eukprot:TRINITY_DN14221_c0_g1_i2.p1 TRINITY_DN14221_c0_g1~~TRINITY_DN14221_c0_g1_i2.p1  ORF type:complete len:131 (+),score=6.37 TRINITY_DN14221_c0_g1_i2:118-510(+)